MDNRKGSILIISLWALCLLTSFAISLSYGVRQKILLVQRLEERAKLRLIAEAGVKRAIAELKDEVKADEQQEKTYDSLTDGWSNNIGAFEDIKAGDGRFSVYSTYIDEESGVKVTQYGLVDEERKVNLNEANQTVLENLFRIVLGFDEVAAQELAASIIDWRDSDSELSIPVGSAEDSYYRSLKRPYEAKDAKFELLDEILLVKGVTPAVFDKLGDYVTIYGDGGININTTSKEVLLSLGLELNTVDKIISFRRGKDGIIGTIDDNAFRERSSIVPDLSQYTDLTDGEVAELSRIVNRLSTKSNNFIVRSLAKLDNRKNTSEVLSVVNKAGDILYWREP